MLSKKRYALALLICFCMTLFSGCKSNNAIKADAPYYTFKDSLNNTVILKKKPQRVVALFGSYAEAWALSGGKLAGVTSDVISEKRMNVPKGTKVVGNMEQPNIEEILALSPDFVLLSPEFQSHVKIAETLKKANIPYAFFKVEYFQDYLNMLKIFTDITGNKALYEKNGLSVQKQIEDVLSKVPESDKSKKPSVLFIRAYSSGAEAKSGDDMTSKILQDLGTVNIADKQKSLLKDLNIEAIIQENPDYIFVTTMGDTDKAIDYLKKGIEKNPAWSSLKAVKDNKVFVIPKELFQYKPNAKWGESYEYLAKILYPQIFK